MRAQDLRRKYIEFFVERHHQHVASAPLVPPDDPTLLFTTAGMVQFKRYYSGSVELPYARACSVQKCLRAGGKGSDLENVGRTLRHHTFFEMLGNFSFGDYFKREAISWAWEFSTKVVGLDPARCYASVFEDDDEAWDIWTKEISLPADRMVRLGAKDNFWGPAGDTGACGPCSEIYYDRGEEYGPGLTFQHATVQDDDPNTRYIEFWNCVFPQFDQQKDGSRPPLKNRGVDTGMGLERLACITQNCASPFETDLLFPIVEHICSSAGLGNYRSLPVEQRQAVNVVADHTRALTFALSEGILPGNEGRGYVLRRMLRRAVRYARRFGQEKPFLSGIVDSVIEVMAPTYPELLQAPELTKRVIRAEEEAFALTLGGGLVRLESLLEKSGNKVLNGGDVFTLCSTYGLPYDDIAEIARDRNYTIDQEGYRTHIERHREDSRQGVKGTRFEGIHEYLKGIFDHYGKTNFVGYPPTPDEFQMDDDEMMEYLDKGDIQAKVIELGLHTRGEDDETTGEIDSETLDYGDDIDLVYPVESASNLEILGMFRGNEPVSRAVAGEEIAIVLESTPCYAESGGQVGDTGYLRTEHAVVRITETQKTAEEIIVHYGTVESGELRESEFVHASIDMDRRWAIMRNHTATHLLQGALKRVVGQHIAQQGSYVGPDHLRFDFTNPEAVTQEQLLEVEQLVNEQIQANSLVETSVLSLDEAQSLPGIIAPFGEKYGGTVRVVDIPGWDIEFCGGTHMDETGGIGVFVIVSEGAVSSGVRRIEAVTGMRALDLIQRERATLKSLGEELSTPRDRVIERVAAMQEELKSARRTIAAMKAKTSASEADDLLAAATDIGGVKLVTRNLGDADAGGLRAAFDALRSKNPGPLVAILAGSAEGRVTLIAGATPEAIATGASASDLVRALAPIIGGSGGGKKEMAQAGGKSPEKVDEALALAASILREQLKVNAS